MISYAWSILDPFLYFRQFHLIVGYNLKILNSIVIIYQLTQSRLFSRSNPCLISRVDIGIALGLTRMAPGWMVHRGGVVPWRVLWRWHHAVPTTLNGCGQDLRTENAFLCGHHEATRKPIFEAHWRRRALLFLLSLVLSVRDQTHFQLGQNFAAA